MLTLTPIYATLAMANAKSYALSKESGRYWTAIYDSRLNAWRLTDRFHPKSAH